jgi:flagellar capping protein FliD
MLLDKKDEQIRTAQSQIDTLIKQNQEQFNRFMSLLEAMQKV